MPSAKSINIHGVIIGGGAPVKVQSMLDFPVTKLQRAINTTQKLARAGCELIRVAVPDHPAVEAMQKFVKAVSIPVIADIHFDPKIAMEALDCVHKLRLNPTNITNKIALREIVLKAKDKNVPIRVGVNMGGVYKNKATKHSIAFALDAVENEVELLEKTGFAQIVVSAKSANPEECIELNRALASRFKYPIHIGVTEAGTVSAGTVKSAYVLGTLLKEGIGDTIRVSLAGDKLNEIKVAYEILRATGIRNRGVNLIVCPSCGRAEFDVAKTATTLERTLANVEKPLSIAVMGCIVNGPGEAFQADFGLVGCKNGIAVYKKKKIIARKLDAKKALTIISNQILKLH